MGSQPLSRLMTRRPFPDLHEQGIYWTRVLGTRSDPCTRKGRLEVVFNPVPKATCRGKVILVQKS